MKRNNKLLAALNSLLIEKLTTINQLMVYSEMCENLGYSNLHKVIQTQAMDQMLLAEWLMERIRFCEGSAPLSKLNRIMIDKIVSELIEKYETNELEAFQSYSNAIELAAQVNDSETVEVLSKILMKEKGHASWAQNQRAEIENKGMEKYLLNHLGRLVN